MSVVYEIKSKLAKTNTDGVKEYRTAVLRSGELRDGGETRSYKKVVRLDNDVGEDETNVNDYLKIGGEIIQTNAITISCWIKPEGTSTMPAGIVLNNSPETSNLCGVVLNPNGEEWSVGYMWGAGDENYEHDFQISISKTEWTHVVVIAYPSGMARLFVNGVYVGINDEGYVRESKALDNLEIGRFSGMIDNVALYSDTLDYGNVDMDQPAKYEVANLYTADKKSFGAESTTPLTYTKIPSNPEDFQDLTEGLRFYYMQETEYVEAHSAYLANTVKSMNNGVTEKHAFAAQDTEQLNEQKAELVGGINAGSRRYARGKFRTIPGEITENQ